ncbi:hypothetical protein M9H77_03438 [Catharanthus roseus]|uniref:Uncharacterized protein n=1 Tax=Catharanthus roseus TaxID=4058 RepID=A0ACC0CBF1_CATRO|nr:hypothetical protein M9H77_03438 [Catharanthus roseus]
MRDIRRDVTNLSNQQIEFSPHGNLNATTPSSNGPFNCSRTTNFIHLLTVVEEAVLEEETCLDTLKKFQDHKLGMESHYMMIMNINGMMRSSFPNQRQVATTKPPTSNFKPWQKKEEITKTYFPMRCPETYEMHVQHLREVLNVLRIEKLFANLDKCDLHRPHRIHIRNRQHANRKLTHT